MSPILRRWKQSSTGDPDVDWSGGDANPPPPPPADPVAARIAAIQIVNGRWLTKPSLSTTGTYSTTVKPRTPLNVPNEGRYTLSNGEHLVDRDIYGCVTMVNNSSLTNCRVWGSPPLVSNPSNLHQELIRLTHTSLVDKNSCTITDCDLTPNPAYQYNYQTYGFKGGGAKFIRCHISRVVDGGQTFNKDTYFEHCYIHDLAGDDQRSNSPTSGHTHDDGNQVEGGTGCGVEMVGCFIDVYQAPGNGEDPGNYIGILMSNNTGPAKYLKLRDNWIRGGGYSINLDYHSTTPVVPGGVIEITGNRISLGQSWARHVIANSTITGMWTFTDNEDYDTGDPTMLIGAP